MKNFLTKAFVCAGVLASALALSSVATFAADSVITADAFYNNAETGTAAISPTSTYSDSNITATLGGTEVYATYNGLFTATKGNNDTMTNETGKTWDNEFYNTGSSRTITINAQKAGTITFYYYVSDTGKQIAIGSDKSDKLSAKYTVSSYTFEIPAGNTSVTWPNKAAFLEMDYTKIAGEEYSITGTQTGLSAGDTFTLTATDKTEYTATVGTDGSNWSVSKTSTSSPFANNETFTVSVNNYTANPNEITITGSGTSYNASTLISFSEIPLNELAANTYTTADILNGKPNFDISNVNFSNSKFTTGDSITFKLSGEATVTVNARSGGDKNPELNLNGGDAKTVSDKTSDNDFTFTGIDGDNVLNIVAGEKGKTSMYINSITIKYPVNLTDTEDSPYTADGGLVVVKNNEVYAIGKITGNIDALPSTVTLTVGKKSYTGKTEVFKQVKVGGVSVTGDAVDGVYYLGIKVNNVPNDAAAESLASMIELA